MDGKKTYIVAALMGLLAVIYTLGMVDETMYKTIQGLLLGGGLAALRNAKS